MEAITPVGSPKTKIGEEQVARFPRSKFPNAIWSPYDIYTIVKDNDGNLWFGTATAGYVASMDNLLVGFTRNI
jgi:hypothetical protein